MIDLQAIKDEHRSLFAAFCRTRERKPDHRFATDLSRFLGNLRVAATEARQAEDYLWFRDALEQWRTAGPTLGIPVDMILEPPSLEESPDAVTADERFQTWVTKKAHDIGRERVVAWYNSRSVDEIMAIYRQRIGEHEAWRRQSDDWAQAETHLAADVIERRVDLVNEFGADSYWRLEGKDGRMWLPRVVALKAYYRWEEKGHGWGEEQAAADYLWAEQTLRGYVNDRANKAARVAFEPVDAYIRARYLDATGKICATGPAVDWIRAKAGRLVELHPALTWAEAEQRATRSVTDFYEHIAAAVLSGQAASVDRVQAALGLRTGFEEIFPTVNCFEFAIAVYFLEGPNV